MSWQEKVVCRILCAVARIVGKHMPEEYLKEIKDLSLHIQYGNLSQEKTNV